MADNVELNLQAGGQKVATDDDGTAQHQYVKVEFGADDTQTKVTSTVGLPVSEITPSTLIAFITDIPTAGTRVQLASNTIIAGVFEAPSTNTGNVFIGGSDVSSTVFGAELQPGQSIGVAIDDTDNIWIDAATSGDDVAFLGS